MIIPHKKLLYRTEQKNHLFCQPKKRNLKYEKKRSDAETDITYHTQSTA